MIATEKLDCLPIVNVKQASSVLFQLLAKQSSEKHSNKKRKLLVEDASAKINLLLVVKKIPHIHTRKVIRINLPHPINSKAVRICLLVKDLKLKDSDNEEAQLHYKEMLASNGIDFISEVIPLHLLRTEYQTYESKRKLCQSYDLFIADKDLENFLPSMLGKEFLLKKKMPSKVNMKGNNLKEKLQEIRDSTYLYLHEQGTQLVEVGLTNQREEDVEENIMAVANMLSRFLPGGWNNIRQLHLKAQATMAIPLYVSFESADNVVLKELNESPNEPIIGELATVKSGLVAVYPSGKVTVINNKKPSKKNSTNAKESALAATIC